MEHEFYTISLINREGEHYKGSVCIYLVFSCNHSLFP